MKIDTKKKYLATLLWLTPLFVLADGLGLDAAKNVGGLKGGLVEMITNLIKSALGLVGVLALAMIVYGGFLYVTAAGDEKQITKGKTVLIYAIIGIIVIGVAYSLVSFVIGAFISGGSGGGSGMPPGGGGL
ncbi:MAG: hypothetical protein Q7S57_00160 [bacterium]|nr:hypothetical protein [bacterium]